MANDDPLCQRFRQSLDVISLVQSSEWRGPIVRTCSRSSDGMTRGAIPFGNGAAALHFRCRLGCSTGEQRPRHSKQKSEGDTIFMSDSLKSRPKIRSPPDPVLIQVNSLMTKKA
jgi:hypothetical protein